MTNARETRTAIARNDAPSLRYVPALDGIRFIAIALVVISHLIAPPFFGGGVGVDVFFVLSGYLITTILMTDISASRLSLKRFYGRRMIRLAPALIITVVVTTPVALALSSQHRDIVIGAVFALLYLTPLTSALLPTPGSWFGHTWSLGLEEYFYLIWPLALIVLFRRFVSWRTAASLVGGVGVLLLALRTAAAPLDADAIGQFRVGGIALGCALAIAMRHGWMVRRPGTILAIGLIAIIGSGFLCQPGIGSGASFLVADLGAAAMIAAISQGAKGPIRSFLDWSPVVYLGKISYELYLIHYPVLAAAEFATHEPARQVAWWVAIVSIGLAAAIHECFAPLQRRLRSALDRKLGITQPRTHRQTAPE